MFEFMTKNMFFWQMTDPPKLHLLLQRHTVALSPVLGGVFVGGVGEDDPTEPTLKTGLNATVCFCNNKYNDIDN
jgi:hypothetical protein